MFVLMPLSWLARVSNFCFNLLSLFFLIICILSLQAISVQSLLYPFFPRFPWSTFLPFPSYFNFHNLMYFWIDVSMHDMTIPPQRAVNYHFLNLTTTVTLPQRTSGNTLSTSLTWHIILIFDAPAHATSPHPQQ